MANTNKKNTKATVKTVEIPEAELKGIVNSLAKTIAMQISLMTYYQRESELKKHHRAYLHVREEAERAIIDYTNQINEILLNYGDIMDEITDSDDHCDTCGNPDCKISPIHLADDEDFEDIEDEEEDVDPAEIDADDMVVMRYDDLAKLQADMIDLIDTVDDLTELFEAMLTVVTKLASFGNPDAFALVTEAKLTADHIFDKLENSKLEKIG